MSTIKFNRVTFTGADDSVRGVELREFVKRCHMPSFIIEWTRNPDGSKGKAMQRGPRNPNWRGGRVIASNGYVLLRVGIGHHLADVRGYAYEHRVIAEQALGRRLREGEIVHHRDGDKQNNAPGNLEVAESIAHHLFHHRRTSVPKRSPGQANTVRACECGCGQLFRAFDASGRPRRFVTGHNMKNQEARRG